jgi:hypothetical protein
MTYKLYKVPGNLDAAMKTNEDGSITSFIFDPANTDYQAFLAWLAEGNELLPADTTEENQIV